MRKVNEVNEVNGKPKEDVNEAREVETTQVALPALVPEVGAH